MVESIQGRGRVSDHGVYGVPGTVSVPSANTMSTATWCRKRRNTKRKRGVPETTGNRSGSPD